MHCFAIDRCVRICFSVYSTLVHSIGVMLHTRFVVCAMMRFAFKVGAMVLLCSNNDSRERHIREGSKGRRGLCEVTKGKEGGMRG